MERISLEDRLWVWGGEKAQLWRMEVVMAAAEAEEQKLSLCLNSEVAFGERH